MCTVAYTRPESHTGKNCLLSILLTCIFIYVFSVSFVFFCLFVCVVGCFFVCSSGDLCSWLKKSRETYANQSEQTCFFTQPIRTEKQTTCLNTHALTRLASVARFCWSWFIASWYSLVTSRFADVFTPWHNNVAKAMCSKIMIPCSATREAYFSEVCVFRRLFSKIVKAGVLRVWKSVKKCGNFKASFPLLEKSMEFCPSCHILQTFQAHNTVRFLYLSFKFES